MAIGSFSSGGILSAYGWQIVLWVSFVPVILAVATLFLIRRNNIVANKLR
jgi:predicted MFS family arabinose efflux permease